MLYFEKRYIPFGLIKEYATVKESAYTCICMTSDAKFAISFIFYNFHFNFHFLHTVLPITFVYYVPCSNGVAMWKKSPQRVLSAEGISATGKSSSVLSGDLRFTWRLCP